MNTNNTVAFEPIADIFFEALADVDVAGGIEYAVGVGVAVVLELAVGVLSR